MPAISVADVTAAESANLVFLVTLSPVAYQTVVVSYATMDGTAEEGKDYISISNATLTFMPSASSGQITVSVINDDITEGNEDLTLTLSNATNATLAVGASAATGTITDDEMPTLSISATTSSITEGTAAVFIISSSNSPMNDTVIGVAGTEDGDFVTNPLPIAVTLAANETTATITVATTDDGIDEADGSLTLSLNIGSTLPNYQEGSASAATVNIEDNDGPGISVADSSLAETDGQMMFTVSLSAAPVEQTEVSWTTADNTTPGAMRATAGTDYIMNSGALTFAANGNTEMSVTVRIVNDDAVEPDETFLLLLSDPTNNATLSDAEATGTITSEDVPAVHITADQSAITEGDTALFTVTADQEPLADLTINISTTLNPDSFRTGTPPATVTLAAGATTAAYIVNTQSVTGTSTGTITAVVNNGTGYSVGTPTSATVTILDSTTRRVDISGPATVTEADNATVQFTVALSSPPAATDHTVTVNYATMDGTAIMNNDYTAASGTLTFTGNETSKTVTVTILNDTTFENPNERFQMQISNPQPTQGNEPGTAIAEVDIVDDDQITLSIAPVSGKATVAEALNATLAYEVNFPSSGATQVQNDLVLNYTVTGSATSNTDYTAPSGSLTFSSSDGTNQTVLVTVLDDNLVEKDETVVLTLGIPTQPRVTLATGSTSATGTIIDDEMPTLSISVATSPITEGADAIFLITSSNSPMDDTVIGVMGSEEGDFVTNALPTAVTLAANETTATLTIATTDDSTDEADGSLTLSFNIDNTLSNYMAGSAATVNIEDNDVPAISVANTIAVESTNLVFLVTLSPVAYQTVVVNYMTADGSAEAGKDYIAISNATLTFAPSESSGHITVTVLNDDITEGSENLTLTLSDAINATLADPEATGIINDDEMPTLSISTSTSSVTEGDNAVFIITSTNSPMDDTTVGVTGVETGDFVTNETLPNAVVLAANETTATLTVATTDDNADESDGSLTMQFNIGSTLPNYQEGSTSAATVNIADNDGPAISVADASATETDGQIIFIVSLSSTPVKQTEVSWTTADDTTSGAAQATSGTDYITASGTLTFAANGNISMNVTVNIVNDSEVEPDETFLLTLSDPTVDATLADAEATGTITSEDVPAIHITADQSAITEGDTALFTITADQQPLTDMTINISTAVNPDSFRTGTPPATVTLAVGTTSATYIVNTQVVTGTDTGTITATVNGDTTYIVGTPTSATVTILDSTTRRIDISGPATVTEADNATVQFTVMLSSPPDATGHTVTVNYTTSDDTAIMSSDYTAASGTLTFTNSETSKTVTVTILNDTVYENPDEQFQIQVSNPQPSPGNDIGTAMASVNIEDDDQITLSIVPVIGKASVAEAPNATLAYEVRFPSNGATHVQNDLALNYAVDNISTATSNTDYTAPSGSLTFSNSDGTNQTVLVTVLDDDIVESDETVILTLGTPTQPRVTLATGSISAIGTITDDEMPTLSISAVTSPIIEGADAIFLITSTSSPMDDTIVGVMGSEKGDFVTNALPTSVTLAANETTATLTIATTDDDTDEADGSLTLSLNIGNTLPNYMVGNAASVNIEDNDGPAISIADASAAEPDGQVVFIVTLSAAPAEQTEVSWATSNDGVSGARQATASTAQNPLPTTDYIAASGTLTFAANGKTRMSVTVSIVNDSEVEPDEIFLLELSTPSNDATNTNATATGTITSEDVPALHITADQAAITEGDDALFTITADQQPLTNLTININTTIAPDSFRTGTRLAPVIIAADTTVAAYTVNTQVVSGTDTGTITVTVNGGGTTYTTTSPTSATVVILDSTTRRIDISGPVTVTEADNARAEFIVMLSSPPTVTDHTVTVNYATSVSASNPATAGSDSTIPDADYIATAGTLTFAGSETSKTVTVTILNDTVYEQPNERFQIQLSNPQPVSGNELGAATADVDIVDDDRITLSIAPVSGKDSVAEAPNATLEFEVSFTGATQVQNNLTVSYTVDNTSTATAGGNAAEGKNDYTAPSGSLTFSSNDGISQTIFVTVLDDAITESDETIILTLSIPTQPRVTLATGSTSAIGTITDNDAITPPPPPPLSPEPPPPSPLPTPTPVITIAANASTITEGETAVFNITPSLAPTTNLTVLLTVTEEGNRSLREQSHTLTLPAGTTTATFTVTTINDNSDEPDATITATLTPPTTPSNYTLGSPASARVTVKDDDLMELSITAVTTPITEGQRATFRITASSTLPVNMTVAMTVTQLGDFMSKTPSATMQFRSGQTTELLHIATDDDEQEEGDGLITVTLNAGTEYRLNENTNTGTNTSASIVVLDNDRAIDNTQQVNQNILPYLAITMADETTWAIQNRIEAAFAGNRSRELLVQGSKLGQFVIKQLQKAADKQDSQESLRLMPHDIVFAFTLDANNAASTTNAASTNNGTPRSNSLNTTPIPDFGSETGSREWWHELTLWGRGYHHKLSVTEGATHFNGTIQGGLIGLDSIAPGFLGGMVITESDAELEFQHGDYSGVHKTEVRGMYPYFAWEFDDGLQLWTTLGLNKGDITIIADDGTGTRHTNDIAMHTLALGASHPLHEVRRADSFTRMSFVGHGVFTRVEEEEKREEPNPAPVEAGRMRIGLELSHKRFMDAGNISSNVQLAWRQDFGDATIAHGAEVTGGLAFSSAAGLRFSLVGRTLHTRKYGVEEWGVGGDLSWKTSEDESGLSVSFKPNWGGGTDSRQQQFWGTGLLNSAQHRSSNSENNAAAHYQLELKYGIPFRLYGGRDTHSSRGAQDSRIAGNTYNTPNNMLTLFARSNIQSANKTLTLGADIKLQQGLSAGYEALMQPGLNNGQPATQPDRQANSTLNGNTTSRAYAQPGSAAYQSYLQTGRTDYNPLMWLGELQHPLLSPTNNTGFTLPGGAGRQPGTTSSGTEILHRAYLKYSREF
ncbi:MAG: Calx-beta domain-containing protein [Pseudohongiellaceae bacterium]